MLPSPLAYSQTTRPHNRNTHMSMWRKKEEQLEGVHVLHESRDRHKSVARTQTTSADRSQMSRHFCAMTYHSSNMTRGTPSISRKRAPATVSGSPVSGSFSRIQSLDLCHSCLQASMPSLSG